MRQDTMRITIIAPHRSKQMKRSCIVYVMNRDLAKGTLVQGISSIVSLMLKLTSTKCWFKSEGIIHPLHDIICSSYKNYYFMQIYKYGNGKCTIFSPKLDIAYLYTVEPSSYHFEFQKSKNWNFSVSGDISLEILVFIYVYDSKQWLVPFLNQYGMLWLVPSSVVQ